MHEEGKMQQAIRTLVLLPGMDGTGLLFEDLGQALGEQIEQIVVSYPMQKPLGYADLEVLVRDVLPQNRSYVLLAESFSGPLAIAIAASRPPQLKGLILSASFAANPRPLLRHARWFLRKGLIAAIPPAWLDFFLLGKFSSESLRRKLAHALSRVTPEVLHARANAVLTVDTRAALSRIQVPMLYLQADADRTVPSTAFAWVRRYAPQCELEIFPAPHFLLQTVPAQAAARIKAFVAACTKKEAACAAESGE